MYVNVTSSSLDQLAVVQLINLAEGLNGILQAQADEATLSPVAGFCATAIVRGVGLECEEIASMESLKEWLSKTFRAIKNKIDDAFDKLKISFIGLVDSAKKQSKELDLAVKRYERVKDNVPDKDTVAVGKGLWALLLRNRVPKDLAGEFKRMAGHIPDSDAMDVFIKSLLDGRVGKKLLDGYATNNTSKAISDIHNLAEATQEAVEHKLLAQAKPVRQSDTTIDRKVEGKLVATDFLLGNWRVVFELPKDKKALGSTLWATENDSSVDSKAQDDLEVPLLSAETVSDTHRAIKDLFGIASDVDKMLIDYSIGYAKLTEAANMVGKAASRQGQPKEWFDAYNDLMTYQFDVMNMMGRLYIVTMERAINSAKAFTQYVNATTKALEK